MLNLNIGIGSWTVIVFPFILLGAFGVFEESWLAAWYQILCWSGTISVVFFVLTMISSPLKVLFPSVRFFKRLARYRQEMGVATFIYAAFHLVAYGVHRYLKHGTIPWGSISHPFLIPGFLAFTIFFLLAVTSNHWSMNRIGWKRWKRLHNWAHLAQWLVLIHAFCVDLANRNSSAILPLCLMVGLLVLQLFRRRVERNANRKRANG